MNLPKRLRNIAQTQINAIKDKLDKIDSDADDAAEVDAQRKRYERDARRELDDIADFGPPLRTPEEIAGGKVRPAAKLAAADRPAATTAKPIESPAAPPQQPVETNALTRHYKVLGVEVDADYSTVQAAYSKLAARCDPERFAEGSEERKAAEEIRKRVDAAYDALRDALDATAGRFDKLEF